MVGRWGDIAIVSRGDKRLVTEPRALTPADPTRFRPTAESLTATHQRTPSCRLGRGRDFAVGGMEKRVLGFR